MTTFALMANSPASLHQAVLQVYQQAKAEPGALWEIRATTVDRRKRIAMRGAYHGIILPAIAQQAMVLCPFTMRTVLRTPSAWKELFRELFIPPTVQERVNRRTGEAKLVLVKRSTEDLTDDEYQDFILKVQALAVTDLNVVFPEEQPL